MDRARVAEILDQLTALETDIASRLKPDSDKVDAAVSRVALSWSGSTLGHHSEMYFERFQRPPRGHAFNVEWGTQMGWPSGWFIPTVEEVEAELTRISGVDLAAWKERCREMLPKLRDLRDALVVEIPAKGSYADPRFTRLVTAIEETVFDDSHAKEHLRQTVNAHMPSASRDFRAATAGGFTMPTHLCYGAIAEGLSDTQKNLSELIKNTRLLLRHIEVNEESNAARRSAETRTMLEMMANDPLTLRKADGAIRQFRGLISTGKLTTFDSTLPCTEGDVVERELPNGQVDRFEILDTGFNAGLPPDIAPHFQMKIRKVTQLPQPATPGGTVHITYNVTGPNARFNNQAVDNSHNVVGVGEAELFQKLKDAIRATPEDVAQRDQLLLAVDEMSVHAGKPTFGDRFQSFMGLAANCMAVITPFLPALANLAASAQN